jgi:hypothetical protein
MSDITYDKKTNTGGEFNLSMDLRNHQSVRATFKLSSGCIEAISIVAGQLGIKQKSIFDHLVEDLEGLKEIARRMSDIPHPSNRDRIQKTFVISRRSLLSLETVASSFNTPRDALVELLVQRLLPLIARERLKHDQRKKLIKHVAEYRRQGRLLAEKLKSGLGTDDPMVAQFGMVMSSFDNALVHISDLMERGQVLEAFHIEVTEEEKQTEEASR